MDNDVSYPINSLNFTCDDCRWKIERHGCPWNFDYDEEHPWAEDCIDFRWIKNESDAFKEVTTCQSL